MKASKLAKGEAVLLIIAIVVIVIAAILIKTNFFEGKEQFTPISEDKDFRYAVSENKLSIVEKQTESEIVQVEFQELKTNISEIKSKTIKTSSPEFSSDIFTVDESTQFENAKITLKKKGNVDVILYCRTFDFRNENCSEGWQRTDIPFTQTKDTVIFNVPHFSAYVAGVNESLLIYGYSKPPNVQVDFYAEYKTFIEGGASLGDLSANLTINFSDGSIANMTYNLPKGRWHYNRTFSSEGTFFYTVQTESSLYQNMNTTDNVTIFNCTVPHDEFYINNDTSFCPGEYYLNDSANDGILKINSSNLVIDCSGSTVYPLGGSSSNVYTYIYSNGYENITIKNCNAGLFLYRFVSFSNSKNITILNTHNQLGPISSFTHCDDISIVNSVFQTGISITATTLSVSFANNLSIINSSIRHLYENVGSALGLNSVNNTLIQDSVFEKGSYNTFYGTVAFQNLKNIVINNSIIKFSGLDFSNVDNFSMYNSSVLTGNYGRSLAGSGTNLMFKNNLIQGIRISYAENSSFFNNTISYCDYYYPTDICKIYGKNLSIKNNLFTSISGGLFNYIFQINNSVVQGNIFNYSSNTYDYVLTFNNSYSNEIRDNVISSANYGFMFKNMTDNNIIDNLTIYNSTNTALFFGGKSSNIFNNLLIYNCSNAIIASENITIENSTLANNSVDLNIYENKKANLKNVILTKVSKTGAGQALINATNLTFTNPTRTSSITFNDVILTNIMAPIKLGPNSIFMNVSNYPGMNKTATLTFRNLVWSNVPILLKDGVRCDNTDHCNITSYDNVYGTLVAKVSGFSNYTTNGSDCYNVTDDLYIVKDTKICSGTYYVNDTNNDGIIIFNASGTVTDNIGVIFNSPVTIIGNGSGKAIVSINYDHVGFIVSASSTPAKIYNFTYGVYFENTDGSFVSDALFKGNKQGIFLENSTNATLSYVAVNQSEKAIVFHKGERNTLSYGSRIGNNTYGFVVDHSNNNIFFSSVKIKNNRYGIFMNNSDNLMFSAASDDLVGNQFGMYLRNSHNIALADNFVTHDNDVAIYAENSSLKTYYPSAYSGQVRFLNNQISLLLKDSYVNMSRVTFNNSQTAINSINSEINISKSKFNNNDVALFFNSTKKSSVTYTNFSGNDINFYLKNSRGVVVNNNLVIGGVDYDFFLINSNLTLSLLTLQNPLFSDATSLLNITQFSLYSSDASIRFKNFFSDDTINTTSGVYLLYNLAGLDTSSSPGLNRTAQISIFNLLWPETPFIFKDGVRCDNSSDCNVEKYNVSTGTLIFNVTGFSNYTTDNPNLPGTPDLTPPTQPNVYDGLNFIDFDWTSSNNTLHASWSGSFDRSDIFYLYRIMDSNGSCYAGQCALKDVGSATQVSVKNLSLKECHEYYFEVQAEDTYYNRANITASDGITIDLHDPIVGPNGCTPTSSSHPSQSVYYPKNDIELNWSDDSFVDDNSSGCISGIAGYSYLISQDQYDIPDEIIDLNDTNITIKDVPSGTWHFIYKAIDNAGNAGDICTRQFRINVTEAELSLDPVESPTLLGEIEVSGDITKNISNKLIVYVNTINVKNVTITSQQTSFSFNISLNIGINSIYVNASLSNDIIATSNTIFVNRLNETKYNVTGFTLSYAGGSLTDASQSDLLFTDATAADYGIGKSSGKLFLFVTRPTSDAASKDTYVTADTFFDQINPTIGFPFETEQNFISTILNYQDLFIIGNQSVQSGRYTLVITNNGSVNGKPEIIVRIS